LAIGYIDNLQKVISLKIAMKQAYIAAIRQAARQQRWK
jgi:hypothetical protein